jgi:hypothetical protein
MTRKATVLALAAAAILLLQFADCLNAISADPETMRCCVSMPCMPANMSHDCCKAMAPGGSQDFDLRAKAPVQIPPQMALAPLRPLNLLIPDHGLAPALEPNEHAPPPQFYTLHHSLLI